ncbi:hypothetical protein T459_17078 [Capsicum annuum]|uniref:RNase H type-1 domain-containing protein n=1 Tax=Capsicum annuum TaxID=4072 RepID=A0A2G2ZAI9_CAPAN|nr:hypothetical protein T459_17078 [Capsicum annuum]
MVDNIKTKLDIIPVRWSNPNLGDLNINIYGFYKVNPGSASGRGTVRNHLDPTIMAFTAYFGYSFNNLVDARAIKIDLRLWINHGFNTLTIEYDSMIVINMINKVTTTAWKHHGRDQ